MAYNAYETYLENRVLMADPLELVCLLYRAAQDSVREARRLLAQGDISGRSRRITHAMEVLQELSSGLNHEVGGDLSERLASLYSYMQQRLFEANAMQKDQPLEEVLLLLVTLSEAWDQVGEKTSRPAPERQSYGFDMVPSSAVETVRQSWTY